MAKKPRGLEKLTFVEIVMRADAEVIKAAHEARVKIDELLAEREMAYQRIIELETEVEQVIGEEGAFAFPPPPAPVAGLDSRDPVNRKARSAASRQGAAKATGSTAAKPKPAAAHEPVAEVPSPEKTPVASQHMPTPANAPKPAGDGADAANGQG